MEVETVECPVCDQQIPVDAVRCPKCNAVFSLSDIEELKKVAREIDQPATAAPAGPEVDKAVDVPHEKKPGLFGKLFGKKK